MCLPSDALFQHLLSYFIFSYLACEVSLHGYSSKAQPLLLTLYEGCLLTAAPPDLEHGVAPLGPAPPVQPQLLGHGVDPPSCCLWPQTRDSASRRLPLTSSQPFLRCHSLALSATAPDLGRGVALLGHHPLGMGSSQLLPLRVAPLGHACELSQPPALVPTHIYTTMYV